MGGKLSKAGDSKPEGQSDHVETARNQAITGGGTGARTVQKSRPANARSVDELDYEFVIRALGKLLLFTKTDPSLVRKVVHGMWERDCDAGMPHFSSDYLDASSVCAICVVPLDCHVLVCEMVCGAVGIAMQFCMV